jgi:hypothetical protein
VKQVNFDAFAAGRTARKTVAAIGKRLGQIDLRDLKSPPRWIDGGSWEFAPNEHMEGGE